MEKLIFVESSFQDKLAKEIAGPKNIIYLEKSLLVRLRQIPRILGLIFKGSDIYIGDHRNFIVLLSLIVGFYRKINLYVLDDGLHSVLIDRYGAKYLYRETNWAKRLVMRLYEERIINLRRYNCIPSGFKKDPPVNKHDIAVFIDQGDLELILLDRIKEIESNYRSFYFAKHPRNKRYNLLNYSDLSFDDLIFSDAKKDVYGVYSTGLIYALKRGHNVFLIRGDVLKDEIPELEFSYVTDIQNILLDMGAVFLE